MTSVNSSSLKLQAPSYFDTKKIEIRPTCLTMSSRHPARRFAPTAVRLRAVRRASARPDPQAFADFLGITFSALSNFENGFALSRGLQDRVISKLTWVTRSWLVDGDEGSLTGTALQRLAPLVAEESDTTKPRSRSRAKAGR